MNSFNRFTAWANVFVVLAILIMVMLALSSCKEREPKYSGGVTELSELCPRVKPELLTPEPWSDFDERSQARASRTCAREYYPNICLVRFIRVEPIHYKAICGRKR